MLIGFSHSNVASFESLKRIYIRKDRLDAGVHIQGGKKKKAITRRREDRYKEYHNDYSIHIYDYWRTDSFRSAVYLTGRLRCAGAVWYALLFFVVYARRVVSV